MKLQDKKIAIVGGGPGGLTLARLLQMRGADVQVYERDIDRHARVQGSPLDLHDESGLAALAKAELMDAFRSKYMEGADRMKIMNPGAQVLFSDHDTKPADNFGHVYFRPEIDRGVLRQILLDSLLPGTVIWNSHFVSMSRQDGGWQLHFKHSADVYADVVVAADGAHSRIRPYITDIKPFYSGITMLEGYVRNAAVVAPEISALLNGGKIMAFGKGQDILMGQKADGEIGFYASFKASEDWADTHQFEFADRQAALEWFRNNYPDWSTIWYELFQTADLPLRPRPIYCMPFDESWESMPDLTMIGDAAHVMPPFAGEGVNMAMLDALELSNGLLNNEYQNIHEAIAGYETGMRERAARAARESLDNGERMHGENALDTMLNFFTHHEE